MNLNSDLERNKVVISIELTSRLKLAFNRSKSKILKVLELNVLRFYANLWHKHCIKSHFIRTSDKIILSKKPNLALIYYISISKI